MAASFVPPSNGAKTIDAIIFYFFVGRNILRQKIARVKTKKTEIFFGQFLNTRKMPSQHILAGFALRNQE